MRRFATLTALLAAMLGGLLLWQRYGLAVVLGDGGWLCLTG
jgi:hypothetical protein